ncbi:siderophore-interacting protein [Streptomyces sp. NPDC050400]|uniref:siderophore-interacting protein n=1 Tax=Streptomyces sp. NPDC050400 TaxID=3365610 RepID=UPI0037B67B00
MSRGNLTTTRVKPETTAPLRLHVLRRTRLSPHFVRVTLGGGDIDRFRPMGHDQWFRLFLPAPGGSADSLDRVPDRLTTLSYLKLLTAPKGDRPVLRNYTVRAHRPDGPEGPELDVDFVLHDHAEAAAPGPAASWAQGCAPGDAVVLVDEGIGFNPPDGVHRVALAADESGLPALAGVLASLPDDTTGTAVAEVPTPEDRQDLTAPPGVEIVWVERGATGPAVPGAAALERARRLPLPDGPFYGWVVGESGLATGLRRHWVEQGVPKDHITFCGYWKAGRSH